MAARYRRQAVYACLLAAVAVASLVAGNAGVSEWPHPGVWVFSLSAFLLVWHFGVLAPGMGLVSLERVPQFGLLLAFEPAIAAGLNAVASLVWPFTSARYRQGSLKVGAIRAIHNASMSVLMLLGAGAVYALLGGSHPLRGIGWADLLPLSGAALVAQAINNAAMATFFWLDGRDVRRVFTPLYAFGDLLFVPVGVLSALIYATASAPVFALYVALIVFFVLSSHASTRNLTTLEAQLGAITTATGATLAGAHRVDEVAERILERTRGLFRFDEFYLVLLDPERNELDFRIHERNGVRLPQRQKRPDAGMFGWIVGSGRAVLLEDVAKGPEEILRTAERTEKPTGSLIAVPLAANGKTVGLLSVQHTEVGAYVPADLNLMRWLAEQAAGALADARAFEELDEYRARLEERVSERTRALERADVEREKLLLDLREKSDALERLSREDPLTGLANRRDFNERLEAELQRAARLDTPFALLLLDLDHFKSVNDRHGHGTGDAALREFADILRTQCRALDLIARHGGEEFAVLLPGVGHEDAQRLGERIRTALADHDWSVVHPGLALTVSAGVSSWCPGATAPAMLSIADNRLYAAKRAGRNRVVA